MKFLVDEKGQKKMIRLVKADRKAAVAQITVPYNRDIQKSICERKNWIREDDWSGEFRFLLQHSGGKARI